MWFSLQIKVLAFLRIPMLFCQRCGVSVGFLLWAPSTHDFIKQCGGVTEEGGGFEKRKVSFVQR